MVSQVVNMSPGAQNVTITLADDGRDAAIDASGSLITLTSGSPTDENSFETPLKVRVLSTYQIRALSQGSVTRQSTGWEHQVGKHPLCITTF